MNTDSDAMLFVIAVVLAAAVTGVAVESVADTLGQVEWRAWWPW